MSHRACWSSLRNTLVAAGLMACCVAASAQAWALAQSKDASGSSAIVFRYLDQPPSDLQRSEHPVRVVFV
jgi:hypothetical protein